MGIIRDLINNTPKEELNKIIRADEDMLEGLIWERKLEYEVGHWYGGISNIKKCIVLPDKPTLKDPNDKLQNEPKFEPDHSPINELQEETRNKYIEEKNKKDSKNLKLVERVFDMEYLLGEHSGFTAIRNNTLDKFMKK